MDLAAEFGLPADELRHRMKEREFYDWTRYVRQRGGLPLQRIETLLAKIAIAFDVGFMGKKNARLSDYLTPHRQDSQEAIANAMETSFASGGTVVRGPVQLRVVSHGK